MAELEKKIQQKNEAMKAIGRRTSIARVLLSFGISMILLILGLLFAISETGGLPLIIAVLGAGAFFFFTYLFLAIKYAKTKTKEQERKKLSVKKMTSTIILLFILSALIIYSFVFFITIIKIPDATAVSKQSYIQTLFPLIIAYFASMPFIMVLWYKTSPGMAARFILKVHKLLVWKSKKTIVKTMVIDVPQHTSFFVIVKRAFTAMTFSLFTTYSIWLQFISPIGFQVGSTTQDTVTNFLAFCGSYFLNHCIPLIASYIIWFWALPPSWLLDDAGIVFYRKKLDQREPATIRTVSDWFLSMVKAIVGTSGLIAYAAKLKEAVETLATMGTVATLHLSLVQIAVFILGFPFFGTMLMGIILLLFQESQGNKLKTFLYQEIIKDQKDPKIKLKYNLDPRLMKIRLEQLDDLQEQTLLKYYGENFVHDPPLEESKKDFTKIGEYSEEELARK
nr:hypothetical protein [Candidatus Sigynarchaeota archaeon]